MLGLFSYEVGQCWGYLVMRWDNFGVASNIAVQIEVMGE